MKKIFTLFFIINLICLICVGCSNEKRQGNTTTTLTTMQNTELSTTFVETTTENQTEKQTNPITDDKSTTTTTKKSQGNGLVSDGDMEKIENSNAEVYFSDNPNDKYIVSVSNKYGVKKENLIALVKVNAEFPGAVVLEFSGEKDANGELIMTYDKLKYVYEINESKNTIVKASKNGFDNDGISFVEAKILVTIAKEYFIPELPNLKENKRLPE